MLVDAAQDHLEKRETHCSHAAASQGMLVDAAQSHSEKTKHIVHMQLPLAFEGETWELTRGETEKAKRGNSHAGKQTRARRGNSHAGKRTGRNVGTHTRFFSFVLGPGAARRALPRGLSASRRALPCGRGASKRALPGGPSASRRALPCGPDASKRPVRFQAARALPGEHFQADRALPGGRFQVDAINKLINVVHMQLPLAFEVRRSGHARRRCTGPSGKERNTSFTCSCFSGHARRRCTEQFGEDKNT